MFSHRAIHTLHQAASLFTQAANHHTLHAIERNVFTPTRKMSYLLHTGSVYDFVRHLVPAEIIQTNKHSPTRTSKLSKRLLVRVQLVFGFKNLKQFITL